ncbi:MAG: D-beta-D-heptose 7-phosphate kinase / D-beta-D-heptose 1-phosphate adenosyltransferase [Solirubrobacteraceae bacterium]|nr:D-beta-D-heptose 7-phosphate kinase / D-beta-D-heptose 1-phosphate adenosyltransferase [Solirubrobacteraceae bacterium]
MTGPASVVVVGDTLLDREVDGDVRRLSPDAPVPVVDERSVRSRPGGAGLAALLASGRGRRVTLITALADDGAGRELRAALLAAGIEIVDLGLEGATPEKIRLRTGSRVLLRLDRGGAAGAVGPARASARAAIGWAGAVLVADYGRGVARDPALREMLAARAARTPLVWDPHPRGPEPVPGATVVTPNAGEAAGFAGVTTPGGASDRAAAHGALLAGRWSAAHVCVTRGARGAVLVDAAGDARAFPAPCEVEGDPCGAGDRFASRVAQALADGAGVAEAVSEGVQAASSFVAAGGAAAIGGRAPGDAGPADADALQVAERARARGGTVVATGGCFDLLHVGHVRTLEAARRLGDCLVVCMNSDGSVRGLKGPGRPLVGEQDRAAVLRSLRCVDAVLVFDEATPERALDRLRPDIWVKGGDYRRADLPETEVVERWGGSVVLLPYLDGHSTTNLIQEATIRAIT